MCEGQPLSSNKVSIIGCAMDFKSIPSRIQLGYGYEQVILTEARKRIVFTLKNDTANSFDVIFIVFLQRSSLLVFIKKIRYD